MDRKIDRQIDRKIDKKRMDEWTGRKVKGRKVTFSN